MLIKKKDSIQKNIEQLENIKQLPNLSKEKLIKVEKELKLLRSGNKGEQDSAYFIDFYYKDSKNWVVIHDFRIEFNGYIAQIDHLLINRTLDFYVLETKHYSHGIKVTGNGEFLVWFRNKYFAIESPIQQNQRHVKVLRKLLEEEDLLPKRLGFSLQPNFLPYILVSPHSRVIRPHKREFNTDMLIKADQFYKQIQESIDNKSTFLCTASIAKIISQDSLRQIGEKLVSYHKPVKINYYDKFGISKIENLKLSCPNEIASQKKINYYCYNCKQAISKKTALFCFKNKSRFQGKAYCYGCQKILKF